MPAGIVFVCVWAKQRPNYLKTFLYIHNMVSEKWPLYIVETYDHGVLLGKRSFDQNPYSFFSFDQDLLPYEATYSNTTLLSHGSLWPSYPVWSPQTSEPWLLDVEIILVALDDVVSGYHIYLGGGFKYIFYVHPYLGKWSNLTNIFQMGSNHQLYSYDFRLGVAP